MLSGMKGCSTVAMRPERVGEDAQHRAHPGRVGLAQRPRRLAIDIGVGGADHLPGLLERLVKRLPVQALAQHRRQRVRGPEQLGVVLGDRPLPGSRPSQFRAISESERCARLPKSLASSTLSRVISACRLEIPVAAEGHLPQQEDSAPDRDRRSPPARAPRSTLPSDLLIFSPSIVHQPCAKIRFGGARPAAIRKAGQ